MTELNGVPTLQDLTLDDGPPPFGKEMQKYFMFDKNYRNLNHGSFGTLPKAVLDVQRKFQELTEASPDRFFRYQQPDFLNDARKALCKLVNASLSCTVLVQNATTAVNTVLRNIIYKPGDKIVYFSTLYGACEKTILSVSETFPVKGVKIPIAYPIDDADLLSAFEATIKREQEQGSNVKVAVFDTISSLPGVRVPFERLVEICRKHGILSCMDAAHSVGQIPMDLDALDPDFFVSNLHKWLYTPRGSAIFYVPERNQHMIRTSLPTSHYFQPLVDENDINNPLPPPDKSKGDTTFTKNFEFVGTIDTSPYLAIPAAIEFRQRVCGGEDKMRAYMSKLQRDGGDRVAQILGTECMDNAERTLRKDTAMVMVRLPLPQASGGAVSEDAGPRGGGHWMSKVMVDDYNTFIAIVHHNGYWWARFSAQVYLDMEDFEWGAKVLLELCERVMKGEHLKG